MNPRVVARTIVPLAGPGTRAECPFYERKHITLPMKIKAITLDLDDTLWPIAPTIQRAETLLHQWIHREAPELGEITPEALREIRNELFESHPHQKHDLAWYRLKALEVIFERAGLDTRRAQAGYEIFLDARQTVIPYPDALPALSMLMQRYPLGALSNGNADVKKIGLSPYFRIALSAKDLGMSKPDPEIFHYACRMLGCKPEEVLHVGDDAHADVVGARKAGLHAAWINRHNADWPQEQHGDPDHHEFADMKELAEWLLKQ